MLIYEYKLDASEAQEASIEEAIRVTQFVRNKALRRWMETRGTTQNDLQCLCAELARDYPFARRPQLPGPASRRLARLVRHLAVLRQVQEEEARQEGLSALPAR